MTSGSGTEGMSASASGSTMRTGSDSASSIPQVSFFMEESKALFMGASGIAITEATFEQLKHEGMKEVEDLAKFKKDILDKVASNLRRPATAPTGGTSYLFGVKSQTRLLAACDLV
eukprot:1088175-Ditylum_brightwellii.AAC.1